MGYEINYNNMEQEQEKRDKAIKDMQYYLNRKQMVTLETVAMEAPVYRQLAFYCSFAGVSGYPVVALWDETRQIMRDMTT